MFCLFNIIIVIIVNQHSYNTITISGMSDNRLTMMDKGGKD